jgi:hypothetical protein
MPPTPNLRENHLKHSSPGCGRRPHRREGALGPNATDNNGRGAPNEAKAMSSVVASRATSLRLPITSVVAGVFCTDA